MKTVYILRFGRDDLDPIIRIAGSFRAAKEIQESIVKNWELGEEIYVREEMVEAQFSDMHLNSVYRYRKDGKEYSFAIEQVYVEF